MYIDETECVTNEECEYCTPYSDPTRSSYSVGITLPYKCDEYGQCIEYDSRYD